MSNSVIRRLLILGGLAIAGILTIQTYTFVRTWSVKGQEFNQTVTIALRKVAETLSEQNQSTLPKQNLIQRRSSNVYAVNVNSAIDANVLEELLEQQFIASSLYTNFEYAVYDCATDNLLYGNYCLLDSEGDSYQDTGELPFFDDFVYYFVVKFPQKEGYLLTTMRQSVIFSVIALLAVLFFLYAIYVILRQRQLTELQTDFINNMTHEFKTPLSSIKIAANVLADSEMIKDEPRLNRYAAIIQEQNQRLNDMVEKVLDIAKMEGKHNKLNLEERDMVAVLTQLTDSERLKFEQESGNLSFETSLAVAKLKFDQLHFANVVTSLLDNAMKYCTQSPQVKIRLTDGGKNYNLSIQDNGIGIDKDNQKKLFNKFYRVPTGNVHNVKGFGLGLFYVKNICDAHGWIISVQSELNRGSTFTIEIPKK